MDKDKLKKELKKLLSDKKVSNVLAILLIVGFILLAANIILPKTSSLETQDNKENVNIENAVATSKYEETEKVELVNILKKINGVGDVEVKINFESDEVKVPAYETTKQNTITEETDNEGGKRTNNQNNDSTKVVMATDKPYILKTEKPKVIGIVVVAEGASNSRIKHDIEVAVTNLYNLAANKVNVYPMK
jgi:stage III sporulation protein AG